MGFNSVAVAVVVGVIQLCVGAEAQDRPDFSGVWTLNEAASEFPAAPLLPPPPPPARNLPPPPPAPRPVALRIAQTPTDLNIERTMGNARKVVFHVVYKLDGSPSVNQVAGVVAASRAVWFGSALQVSIEYTENGNPIGEGTEVYRLEGDTLVVEETLTMQSRTVRRTLVYARAS